MSELAVMTTDHGELVLEFWDDVAPGTVENFKKLAKEGFYDGTCFHRLIAGFMIQGGDPESRDDSKQHLWGTGGPGYTIKAEFNKRQHQRGVISMARSNHPDSAGSQFFICFADVPFLDGQYTCFGKVISGETVLETLEKTPVESSGSGEKSKPVSKVGLESIKIVNRSDWETK